jgi:hypothetical protein
MSLNGPLKDRKAAFETCENEGLYRLAVLSDVPPPVEPWVTESLAAALRDTGCPPETAEYLSTKLRVERSGGSTEWLLMLENHGAGYPADADEVAYAVEHLARNLAADNAEAVDRTARGELGWTPSWPLPDRLPPRK